MRLLHRRAQGVLTPRCVIGLTRVGTLGCIFGIFGILGTLGIFGTPSAAAEPSPAPTRPVVTRSTTVDVVGISGRIVRLRMPLGPVDAGVGNSAVGDSAVGDSAMGEAGARATVSIAGVDVPTQVSLVSSEGTGAQGSGSVMVVLDTSGSMQGERIAAARPAIRAFLQDLPESTKAGLVTFADDVTLQVPATTDRQVLLAALDQVRTGGDTTLFDAISVAVDALPPDGSGRLVVLSDGADTVSDLSLGAVTSKVKSSGVAVDVVALQPTPSERRTLNRLAAPGNGRVITADGVAALLPAFQTAGEAFTTTALLEATVPASLDAQGASVEARLVVGQAEIRAATVLPDDPGLAAATATQALLPPVLATAPDPMVLVLSGMVFCLVLVAALAWILAGRVQRRRRRVEQLDAYGRPLRFASAEPTSSGLVAVLDGLLARSGRARSARAALGAAEIRLTPAGWLLARIIGCLLLAAIGMLLVGSPLLGSLLGIAVGWLGSATWLRMRSVRRQRAFSDELPDFLLLLASGLRGGMSFTHALEAAAMDGMGEVPRQMRRVLREVQVGTLLDDALMECAERMDSEDLRWTVTALSIQREVGGNLSTILDTAASTIKAREELRREVRTLSAEGRLSGYILIALPLGVLLILTLIRRSYVELLWTTSLGLAMLVTMGVLMVLGWLWMRTIVNIKV